MNNPEISDIFLRMQIIMEKSEQIAINMKNILDSMETSLETFAENNNG